MPDRVEFNTLPDAPWLKNLFRELIAKLNAEQGVTVIFEEAAHHRTIASYFQTSVRWHDVEMDDGQLESICAGLGIPSLAYHGRADDEPLITVIEEAREAHWVTTIKTVGMPSDIALLICGVNHLITLEPRLRTEGYDVRPLNSPASNRPMS